MKVTTKKRYGLRSWLPWHAFDGMGLNWRDYGDDVRDMSLREVRRHALILLVLALVIATCATALALPRVALLIDLAGGVAVATVVLFLTGQWQELRRGLAESGQWPEPRVQFEMIRQYILDALVRAQERRALDRLERQRARREEAQE